MVYIVHSLWRPDRALNSLPFLCIVMLCQKLKTFQNEQAADQRVSTLADSVESLQKSVADVEKAHLSKSTDVDSSTAAMEQQIASLRKLLETEMKAHGERVDALAQQSESGDDAPSTEALEARIAALEKKVGRFEKTHKEMKIGLKAVEKLIAEQTKSIRAVHESTIGAIADRWFRAALDFVADVGEVTVAMVQSAVDQVQAIEWRQHFDHYSAKTVETATTVGLSVAATVQSVDWKGHWETVTDPKTYANVLEWFQEVWAYCDLWWYGVPLLFVRAFLFHFDFSALPLSG